MVSCFMVQSDKTVTVLLKMAQPSNGTVAVCVLDYPVFMCQPTYPTNLFYLSLLDLIVNKFVFDSASIVALLV